MIKFYCNLCGHEISYYEHTVENIMREHGLLPCPNCNRNSLIAVEDKEEDDKLAKSISTMELTTMKESISRYGSAQLWYTLESNEDPFSRVAGRYYFFKAGGDMPEREIEI